jgi:hypothetical protein
VTSERKIVVVGIGLTDGTSGIGRGESIVAVEALEHGVAVLIPEGADDLLE